MLGVPRSIRRKNNGYGAVGAAQRALLLERRGEGVLLAVGAGQLADDEGWGGVPELE